MNAVSRRALIRARPTRPHPLRGQTRFAVCPIRLTAPQAARPSGGRRRLWRVSTPRGAGLPHRRLTAVRPAGSHIRGWLIALTAPQAARPFGAVGRFPCRTNQRGYPQGLIRARPIAPSPLRGKLASRFVHPALPRRKRRALSGPSAVFRPGLNLSSPPGWLY